MPEVWLHSNRRVLLLGMVPAALIGVLGIALVQQNMPATMQIVGWGAVGLAVILFIGLLQQIFRPRIAYADGFVRFYIKAGGPIEVPIKIVEAFFLGQGPAHLPGADQDRTKTVNLVARLSQRETDWAQREVKEALGNWKEGYVTLRGTWCEPLNTEVIRRLNHSLSEASKAVAAQEKE